ncbi:hypothetical protein BH24ACI5_BH24ACI5_23660 [soil metagenome]
MGQDKGGHVHAYLLDDGNGLTLVDTLYDDDANVVLAEISRIGRTPSDLKRIILTNWSRQPKTARPIMQLMTAADRRILERFASRVRAIAPEARISAFGSRARGTAHPESDFDLCVVLPAVSPEAREAIYAVAWEIGFADGCVLAPILLSRDDFESAPLSASTLVRTIRREGVAA